MIFEHTWEAVLNGSKWQTRRLVKEGEYAENKLGIWIPDINTHCQKFGSLWDLNNPYRQSNYGPAITNGYRRKWQIGVDYAVQPGRGKKQVGRIRLTGIRQERVQDITEEDAIAEGCEPCLINSGDWYANVPAEMMSARDVYSQIWANIHTKPGTRWEDNPLVWVLEFELVKE